MTTEASAPVRPKVLVPKILVIEDEADIRTFLDMFLSAHGFEVATADNGAAGLEHLAHSLPDLILLDMAMPEMDGMTFLARRAEQPHLRRIPVAVLSARGRGAEIAAAIKAGASTYFTKPFENARLLAGVSQLTRTHVTATVTSGAARVAW